MSHEIRADYTRQYLMPPSLEDWVPQDHPARFIREYVEALDLKGLGFRERKAKDGRPNYSADLLLKAWLYGYMSRIYSTRKLERACREHVSAIWLTGTNAPDHNTLWRFYKDNKRALRDMFKEGVKIAANAGLVGLALHAVDGTKIKAGVAKSSGWHKNDLERILGKLDESVDAAMVEIEAAEEQERGEYRLPKELESREALRRKIKDALAKMKEIDREHLHPGDEDARMMKCDGTIEFAYNAQAVVDEKSGLIVGQDALSAEDDHHLLTEMIGEAEKSLGSVAEETVADGGYVNAEELAKAQERGYGVLMPLEKEKGEYHSSRFQYDADRDVCICPGGEALRYERTRKGTPHRNEFRVYRCRSYRTCPNRRQCSLDKRGRSIEISRYHEAIAHQRLKHEDGRKLAMLKRRSCIIEHVFGHIKEEMAFRRFTMSGLENVKTQWALICTAMNMKKLYRWWASKELALEGMAVQRLRVPIFCYA